MPGATRLASGNELLDVILYLPSVTFPTLAANASANTTFTIPGVLIGDCISWNVQGIPAHLTVDNIYVSANNVIAITWGTDSTGITGATVAMVVEVVRGENTVVSGLSGLPSAIF
jgi:hypothetical protein